MRWVSWWRWHCLTLGWHEWDAVWKKLSLFTWQGSLINHCKGTARKKGVGDLSQWGRHGRKNSNKLPKPGVGVRGRTALLGFVCLWCFCLLWVCWQVWREEIPAWQVSHQCGWWLIALFKLQLCQSQNPWILILDLLLEKVSADEMGPFYWCLKSGISAAASSYYWKERLLWLLALHLSCIFFSSVSVPFFGILSVLTLDFPHWQ